LHLCGYDDLTPAEKRIMRRRERELIALIGS
jgi:ssRNA-specific RNase YbeY (16S rRNA maturation enzyme)